MTETRRSPQPQQDEQAQDTSPELAPLDIARLCAETLDSKKLSDIAVFDVGETLQIADYFVLASGGNFRQIKAACHELEMELRRCDIRPLGIEGYTEGKWVLLDFDVVVVHVFHEEQRRYYDLELLWGDSPKLNLQGGQRVEVGGSESVVGAPDADGP